MKKLVFASVMALALVSLVPALRAQDSSTITIKDRAEYNAYQDATTQSDPKLKAAGLESFLTTYPQSVVKDAVLNMLVDTYQQLGDSDHALSAATRLLQLDPGNFKAILISVAIKKNQCQKTEDPKTGFATDPAPCDDAAALAQKGLTAAKPADTSADDWKKQTTVAYPIFDSSIALDDAAAKKDFKAAEAEYTAELTLYTDDQSKSAGLQDTLLLAQAYGAPGPGHDLIKAVWFYARVWDFAPPAYKARIEPTLEYLYSKYHGGVDGLDAIKTQAATTTFPPGTLVITPADTPAQKIHKILANTPDLNTLALADKELVLAFGAKEDADKLWALLSGKPTPVPGTVIDTKVGSIKVTVTQTTGKPAEFVVNLKTPASRPDILAVGSDLTAQQTYITSSGVAADTDPLTAAFNDTANPVTKIAIEAPISVIEVAVTPDAKESKVPDFIVKLKAPLTEKEVPAAGFEYGLSSKNQAELDGTYDSYAPILGSDNAPESAQIVLRDGVIVPEKKVPAHKPSPAHHVAH
jgi:tetratricopeptide (TPR) repeat protein